VGAERVDLGGGGENDGGVGAHAYIVTHPTSHVKGWNDKSDNTSLDNGDTFWYNLLGRS
jgi:hypothetical protein